MYIPPSNAEYCPEVMFDFIDAHPFGALVTASSEGLFATHLPFVLDRTQGMHGTIAGHVARANRHHRLTAPGTEALVIFLGPDAYITPSWYATKLEHGRVVPTWNYVAVHVYGALRFVDDPAFLARQLEALTAQHEGGRERPWSIDDAPADYITQQARAIIGVELTITRLEGKWKMSQNRPTADIDGVVQGLVESSMEAERAVGKIVDERRPPRDL